MAKHIEALNLAHRDGAKARQMKLVALFGVMPTHPMASYELRDELSQAWEDVYGEDIGSKKAWLEVRFGIRRGVFILQPNGKYVIIQQHGQKDIETGMG